MSDIKQTAGRLRTQLLDLFSHARVNVVDQDVDVGAEDTDTVRLVHIRLPLVAAKALADALDEYEEMRQT